MIKTFVIGNVALDETLSIPDFPRPGASIFGQSLSRDLGGKGTNQATVLARSGVPCILVAGVGRDARGREIAERLAPEPVQAHLLELDDVATDFSTVLMSKQGENAVITTREAASALTPEMARTALADACAGDWLVMQGNLGAETTAAALERARELGMRTAFNPSPLQDYFDSLWPLIDVAFVNEGEAAALGGVEHLLARGVSDIVLTLGGEGAALIRQNQRLDVPAESCAIVDTTGAGDCFMAVALASAIRRGGILDECALAHAARAASHTVARPGTVTAFPTPTEMAAILAR